MAKQYKLDIFKALAAIDARQGGWLAKQPADARADFTPLSAMRWALGRPDSTRGGDRLRLVNECVNLHLWKLQHHPELVFRLLAFCGFNPGERHHWMAGPVMRRNADKARALLAQMHPECNDDEITTLLSLHDRDSFRQYIQECGVQPGDAKAILDAFISQHETAEQTAGKAKAQTKAQTKAKAQTEAQTKAKTQTKATATDL